ncbi:MAG: histidine phosphatase family protein [Deltaproteobacteria bacterium]|nr:histidine phosphatase family protein [Deltaproteobacteria bacterium]
MDVGIAVVMVGLPARGKTFMARKLARYLGWLGYACAFFNVGNYRRATFGAEVPASFFDPGNPDGVAARRKVAMTALDDLLSFHQERGGQISIYDATNSTAERRHLVRERLEAGGLRVLFIESICHDASIVEANIRATKLRAPDYANMEESEAVADFRARIANYERAYETIGDDEGAYVKLIDVGRQLVLNRIAGYVPGRIVNFLMNLHVLARPIWLTRHGQSLANVAGLLGGDEALSADGRDYAHQLKAWLEGRMEKDGDDVVVWTSTLQRTVETAHTVGKPAMQLKALDEIDAGVCDGLTYADVQRKMPAEFAARQADKLRYRYPQGESYEDVIRRLDPVIIELERQRDPVLVVAHQAVLRALFGYFTGAEREAVPHLRVPLHTVLELIPRAYGCEVVKHRLGPRVGESDSG